MNKEIKKWLLGGTVAFSLIFADACSPPASRLREIKKAPEINEVVKTADTKVSERRFSYQSIDKAGNPSCNTSSTIGKPIDGKITVVQKTTAPAGFSCKYARIGTIVMRENNYASLSHQYKSDDGKSDYKNVRSD